MNKKEFKEIIASLYIQFNGDMKFYYDGKYHTQDETKQDLAKFDVELVRKFDNILNSHQEFVAHIRHKLS